MIIAVNTQHLLKDQLEGLGWFTYETLKRITVNHPEHRFVFIFDRPWDPSFIFSNNIIPVKTSLPSTHPFIWYTRFEFAIPSIIKKYKANLFLSTDGWSSLHAGVKTYDVIHDIDFVHKPLKYPYAYRKYYNRYFPLFAKNASRLGTVSEFSKTDIINSWHINPDKIDVIYNGSNPSYIPVNEEEKRLTIQQVTSGNPYFVYIGSLTARKNIEGMLLAFERFKQQTRFPHKLVIVGGRLANHPSIERILGEMFYYEDVIFMGRIAPSVLRLVLGSSVALILVSHLEGFGIPLIEAMNCDVPVICSNVTAMPEVVGKAGILVNPDSVASISEGFIKIAKDNQLRENLIAEARIQRLKFNWDQSASRLWTGIEKCFE
jgi:glycosyltransferase involved in cell wall biosynthesis